MLVSTIFTNDESQVGYDGKNLTVFVEYSGNQIQLKNGKSLNYSVKEIRQPCSTRSAMQSIKSKGDMTTSRKTLP